MLIECGHCGAPLDCEQGDRIVKCSYCAKSNRVGSTRTLHAVTPQAWAPPPTWVDPRTEQVLRASVGATAAAGAGTGGCFTAAISSIIVLAVGAGVLVPMLAAGGGVSSVFGPRWDGSAPLVCGGNDDLEIEGVTANLPGEVAIRATGNCRVELRDCTIEAGNVVVASGNHDVVFHDCTLVASGNGIEAGGNRRVELRNTTLSAAEIGIVVDGNASAIVAGGRVAGGQRAVAVQSQNASAQATMGGQLIDGARK